MFHPELTFHSHENIFQPLGMTTASFYLTPELKAKAIHLTVPVNGKLEIVVNQVPIIEQDPSRGKRLNPPDVSIHLTLPPFSFSFFLQSQTSSWRRRAIQFPERLPHSSTSSSSNQG